MNLLSLHIRDVTALCATARLVQSFQNMKSPTAILFGLLVFTSACGEAFQGADAAPADAGEAGAGPMAGSGGDSSTGGTSQGGSSGTPAVTGGSGAVATGGTAGAAVGGSAGSGDAGSAGEATGGSGGGAPSCAPEDAIVFPESFVWDGFSTRYDSVDKSYCASSSGGTCTFRNPMLSYGTTSEGKAFVSVSANLDCEFETIAGICGAETDCDLAVDPQTQASQDFFIMPDGDGYRLEPKHRETFGWFLEPANCKTIMDPELGQTWSPGGAPASDFRKAFEAFIMASRYACL